MKLEVESQPEYIDERWGRMIHRVEKEYHFMVDNDYPFFKLLSQLDYLVYESKEIAKANKKLK